MNAPPTNPGVRTDSAIETRSCSLGELLASSMTTPLPLRGWCRRAETDCEIWLADGEVVHARFGALEGAVAVCAMLDTRSLRFTIERGCVAPRRSLTLSWGRLCHEARCALVDPEPRAPGVSVTWLDIAVDDLGDQSRGNAVQLLVHGAAVAGSSAPA